jgi:glucosamine--fructose-6-phosphate aminotransferase (isomerizing)
MRREIGQVPAVVERVLASVPGEVGPVARAVAAASPRWVTIAGRGTSDHAAEYAQYLIETCLGLPTGLAKPSVTTVYGASLRWRSGLVVAVSQSGQSPDVIAVLEAARAGGALTLAITNDAGSPLASAAELVLEIHAGRERAVPATKTYVAELAAVAVLVDALRPAAGLADGLHRLPGLLRATVERSEAWLAGDGRPFLEALAGSDRALLVSRGYNLATALELALKLKETVGVFAEAYSTADFAHGPVVLASEGVPTLAIRPDGPIGIDVDASLAQVDRRGGRIAVVGGAEVQDRPRALSLAHELPEALTPIVYVVPGQLLVEATAVRRGIDPDAPTGLRKVTLTR